MKKITSLILLVFFALVGYGQNIGTGFENGVPTDWSIQHEGPGGTPNFRWRVITDAALAHSGSSFLSLTPSTGTATNPVKDWLISPVVNLTNTINPKVTFYGKVRGNVNGNSKLEVRVSTTTNDLTSFTNVIATYDDYLAGTNPMSTVLDQYALKELSLLAYAGQNIYVAFVVVNQGTGRTWSLDDILINDYCPEATNLGVRNVNDVNVTATWTNSLNVPSFDIDVMLASDNPTSFTADYTGVSGTSQLLSNLTPNTEYKYYIRSNCGPNFNSEWAGPFSFTTAHPIASLPYTENFETNSGWQFTNGTQVNKWFIGTAANNGGTRALYISNNDGVDNTYTVNTASVTQAYRDFSIPTDATQLEISFDWKAIGEGTTTRHDYFRVWLVPISFVPVPGTQISVANSQGVQIGGDFNQQSTWETYSTILNLPTGVAGTNRKLVFEWRNDTSVGTQPPAAIDNINIKVLRCSVPTNIVLGAVTQNTAVVSWTAPTTLVPNSYDYFVSQTSQPPADNAVPTGTVTGTTVTLTGLQPGQIYYVWVRGNCASSSTTSRLLGPLSFNTNQNSATLPYVENFDSSTGLVFGISNGVQPNKWYIGSDTFLSSNNSLYISNNNLNNRYTITSASTTFAYRDIAINAGVTQLQVSFDWKSVGEGTVDRMRVWLVPGNTVLTPGTALLTGGQRIQIGGNYSGQVDWLRSNNVVTIPAALAGTTVKLVFEWVNNASAGTQPPAAVDNILVKQITCSVPTNLVLTSVGSNNAVISWTAPTTFVPASYDYFVSQTNIAPADTDVPTGNSTTTSATLTGLQPNQVYYVWVRGNCGSTNGTTYLLGPLTIRTTQVPAILPYSENFDTPGFVFTFNNGTQINKWIVGSDTFLSPNNSLYISDNNINNNYTTVQASVSQAYRDVAIASGAGEMEISFDWKGTGESCCDYFRVWLVPVSFNPTPGTQITALAGQRVQIGGNFNQQVDWINFNSIIDVSAFAGRDMRLVFEWRNDGSVGTQPPAAIDNINLRLLPCSAPTQLLITNFDATSATITWTEPLHNIPSSYDYFVSQTNTPPTDTTVPTGNVVGNTATITSLQPGQLYYIWVRGNCGTSNSRVLGPVQVNTTQLPAQLPYTENFDSPGFVFGFNNGTQVNKWMVGSDTFLSPNRSLYISNNGVNNAYTITSSSVTQAYRDIFIPTNVFEVQLSFNWKAVGEGTSTLFDYMRVWIVPVTFTPTPGTLITAAPDRIQVTPGLNNQPNWAYFSAAINTRNFQNTAVRLVFEWRNDSGTGTQPPAAVDNISVEIVTCSAPINLEATLACDDPGRLDLSWQAGGLETAWEYAVLPAQDPMPTNGTIVYEPEAQFYGLQPNTNYTLWVRALCGGDNGNSVWVATRYTANSGDIAVANPFCAGQDGIVFPNVHSGMNVPNLTTGSFHCLGSTPNPVWYYLEVDQAGRLDFQIVQNTRFDAQGNPVGTTLDVDFIAFGPFENLASACSDIIIETGSPNPGGKIVGCSYSAAAVENFSIINGRPGDVYAILITNYNRAQGFIKLIQTNAGQPGAGLTSCDFLCEVDLGPDRFLCNQDSYLLRANTPTVGGAITSIKWYFEGELMDPAIYNTQNITVNQSGEYSVIIEKENCLGDDPITDSVNIIFASTFGGNIPGIISACDLDFDGSEYFDLNAFAASFIPQGSGFTASFYATIADASAGLNPLQSPYLSAGESIYIKILDGNSSLNCARTQEIELKVIEAFVPIVEFDYDAPICVNGFDSLTPNLITNFTLGGVFSSENGLVINPSTGVIDLNNSKAGDYVVKYSYVVPEGMCGDDSEFLTNVKILDRIGFTIDGYCLAGNYTISALDVLGTLDFSNVTFKWSNNVVSSEEHVAVVDKEGVYTLTVTTIDGCTETVQVEINNVYCSIPKGISPNGDGLNDSFVLTNLRVQNIQIFNRYGQEVYSHGEGYTNQWQGQSKGGGDLPSGTYFYNIVTPFETYTGWVQLVREQK